MLSAGGKIRWILQYAWNERHPNWAAYSLIHEYQLGMLQNEVQVQVEFWKRTHYLEVDISDCYRVYEMAFLHLN
jgi:hypothetical protein